MKYCVSCGEKAGFTSLKTRDDSRVCKECYEKCSDRVKHHWDKLDTQEIVADIARWQERNAVASSEAREEPKTYCANCGGKLGIFGGHEIAEGFSLCGKCVKQCSLLVKEKLSEKTIQDIKKDIMQMQAYPEYHATDRFEKVSFDKVHKLWRADGYPVMKYEDLVDFELIETREMRADSTTTEDKKGREVTNTTYSEYFVRLGIQFMVQGEKTLSFTVNYIDYPVRVELYRKLLKQVQDVAGFLKTILHENNAERKEENTSHAMQISAAEAILKFKELLDYGLITKEEFEAKKKQILNL